MRATDHAGFLFIASLLLHHSSAASNRTHNCAERRSSDDNSAGKARRLQAECMYDAKDGSFSYMISWQPPAVSAIPVRSYMVKILYGKNAEMCFHFNSSVSTFLFDSTKGFRRGRYMVYAVIAQPVPRVARTTLQQGLQCPPAVKLRPLPNKYLAAGDNHTFECLFETGKVFMRGQKYSPPVLNFTIQWYFSKDFNCHNGDVVKPSERLILSKDKRSLTVLGVAAENEGCYLLKVNHASGNYYYGRSDGYSQYDVLQVRGYIHMNNTYRAQTHLALPVKNYFGMKTQLFVALVIGAGLFVVVSFVILMRIWFKKHRFKLLNSAPQLPVMKVYLSHCFNDSADVYTLLKFASVLQSFDIDVVMDVCSDVQINLRGGLSQWIPENIKSADKILVVLTEPYVEMLKIEKGGENVSSVICKIHAEYNYITNIMHNSSHKSNRILLVSKGVTRDQFPPLFENKMFFEFPNNLSATGKGEGMGTNCRNIVEALLERSI